SHVSLPGSFLSCSYMFFFHAPSPTQIYPLSLHDALPISPILKRSVLPALPNDNKATVRLHCERWVLLKSRRVRVHLELRAQRDLDRKSTRLNSSHGSISYAVFCLKKKTQVHYDITQFNNT